MEELKRLNIGCGDVKRDGFENLDLPDFDATKPWGYATASCKVVNMDCVLPHIQDGAKLDFLIRECARVLVPERGIFTFSAPDWRKPSEALQDVHHYRLIGPRTFWHYRTESTGRTLEASGNWFTKPTFKERRVLKTNIEGESRLLPNFVRVGASNLGILTHLWMRTGSINFLRSGRLDWTMWRNNLSWVVPQRNDKGEET